MFEIGDKVMVLEPGRRYPSYVPLFDKLGLINLSDEYYTELYLKYDNSRNVWDDTIEETMIKHYNMVRPKKYSKWVLISMHNHLDSPDTTLGWLQSDDGENSVIELEGQERITTVPIKVLKPHTFTL